MFRGFRRKKPEEKTPEDLELERMLHAVNVAYDAYHPFPINRETTEELYRGFVVRYHIQELAHRYPENRSEFRHIICVNPAEGDLSEPHGGGTVLDALLSTMTAKEVVEICSYNSDNSIVSGACHAGYHETVFGFNLHGDQKVEQAKKLVKKAIDRYLAE